MATYNLIHSVKGGCGKTTFSVWLAYYLKQSLLIDMDLSGTSMSVLFNGNDRIDGLAYTNDVFQGIKENPKKFVRKITWEFLKDKEINVIFSSMDYNAKNKFRAGKRSGYSPVVKHSMFRLGLRDLLKHHKTIEGIPTKHFIFDMPPNSDGFADAAMECVLNPKHSDLKSEDKKNLFMIIGVDRGQTMVTISELKSLLLHEDDREPDKIFVVINHNLGEHFSDEDYEIRKKLVQDELDKWSLSAQTKSKIFFVKIRHNESYTKLGIEGKGLKDANDQEIADAFRAMVLAVDAYGEDFDDISQNDDGNNKLRKLISGEYDAENEKT